ncbi:MAG: HD domain-containing protein [Bacilli bacterium]|nr:HD domain-containing protein [Bacilli bacterium]
MEKMISELNDGMHINGQYLIANSAKCVNNVGAAYLNLELKDSSGSINAKKWEVSLQDEEIFKVGNVVSIEGEVLKYKESLQIKILSAEAVNPSDIDVVKFIKQPPVNKEELIKRFNAHVESIKNEDCRKILDYLIKRLSPKIFEYPAAVSVHHDYASGLLMHTVSMADHGVYFSNYYPDVDKDILLTGILLHDLGKTIEFEGPIIYKYSLEGRLLGHISLMVSEIRRAAEGLKITSEVPLLLEHMVLSHHGQIEFGSPVLPMTKEALLLSMIDNIDSKMVIVEKALEGVKPGEFSSKVFPLDNRFIYKPKE